MDCLLVALDVPSAAEALALADRLRGAVGGTDLAREASLELFLQVGIVDADGHVKPEVTARLKTMPQGAATSVWCATSPQLAGMGGVYCENSDIAVVVNPETPQRSGVAQWAIDPDTAKRLWTLSEELTGVRFPA